MENSPNNIIKIDNNKTVKIPVYSNVRLVDGEVVGELEGYEEFPTELIPGNKTNH